MSSLCSIDSLTQSTTSQTSYHSISSLQDLEIFQKISEMKLTIFSGQMKQDQKPIAIKFFPFQEEKLHTSYKKESLFQDLDHPNVIKFFQCVDDIEIGGKEGSAIIMEKALCDLIHFSEKKGLGKDEVLARSLFHHLIEGIEYLHSVGVAHLDVKPENLLMGSDGNLKLADFEYSHIEGENMIMSHGTANFRSPELLSGSLKEPKQADIYSAGLVLFVLRFGCLAYEEKIGEAETDFFKLLMEDPEEFCRKMKEESQEVDFEADEDFKNLFLRMCKKDFDNRISIEHIKENAWYKGKVYSQAELSQIFKI